MRVCVVSDLHGRLPEIPECDLLLNCGDIGPDMMNVGWDRHLMKMRQTEWAGDVYAAWERTWPSCIKESYATPGNHDWFSKFPDNCRTKMFIDNGVEFQGKTFWFTPWVAPCGDWNFTATRDQRRYYFDNIPAKLDMLVMHGPAFGVGDLTHGHEPAGCREMKNVIQKQQPKYAVFGHIHEGQRYGREFRLGGTKLFSCSMWGNDWKPVLIDLK